MGKNGKYFVDLFAGCGGLSLGLENAGFVPAYVNELDPDAMESYLRNRDKNFPLLREKYNSYDIQENLTVKKNALDELLSNFESDYGTRRGDIALVVGGLIMAGVWLLAREDRQMSDQIEEPAAMAGDRPTDIASATASLDGDRII